MMMSRSESGIGIKFLCALAMAAAFVVCASRASAAEQVNTISPLIYKEKLSRVVKVLHFGPGIPHQTEIRDKGTYSISFVLPLDGIDHTKIAPSSVFNLFIQRPGNAELSATGALSNDPGYEEGDTAVKLKLVQALNLKLVTVLSIKIKMASDFHNAVIQIVGRYQAITTNGDKVAVGASIVADNLLGGPSQSYADSLIVEFSISDRFGNPLIKGVGTVEFDGEVVSSDIDSETGYRTKSKVTLSGP